MGYPADHKQKTRTRIIEAAQRLWKTKGYGGASVDAVMNEAGLTRGGFYAHFKSKEDLFVHALTENRVQEGLKRLNEQGITDPEEQKKAVIDWYLNAYHRDHPDDSCPLTTFTQEAPRLGPAPRHMIAGIIKRFGAWLAGEKKQQKGFATLSLMVGAITLSRSIGPGELSDQILQEAREACHHLLKESQ